MSWSHYLCNGCGECLVQCGYDAVKLEMV
ncbi:4Fe-4S binding protein [Escherichia coli H28]